LRGSKCPNASDASSRGDDHRGTMLNKFGNQSGQSVIAPLRPPDFNRNRLPFRKTRLAKTLAKLSEERSTPRGEPLLTNPTIGNGSAKAEVGNVAAVTPRSLITLRRCMSDHQETKARLPLFDRFFITKSRFREQDPRVSSWKPISMRRQPLSTSKSYHFARHHEGETAFYWP
jgi:hypothetical protein